MNAKQQAILTRQTNEKSAMRTHTMVIEQDPTIKRAVDTSHLALNSQLSQADIGLLNSQMANKARREQINILELWFDWAETAAKVEAQEALTREERGTRFVIELMQFRARGQRELLEAC